ncbi:hypothetical protein J1605_005581 [Eschrichtius robustus]|uniref:PABC domain-containing protein n=1 Tax=Eschrichtius robustus TaxID=9764 RepID=A0AB34H6R1_ESCRO|nr:hypothetical protein J1605_005581 [Eschrichtius robustus]
MRPNPCCSKVGDLEASKKCQVLYASLGVVQLFAIWLQLVMLQPLAASLLPLRESDLSAQTAWLWTLVGLVPPSKGRLTAASLEVFLQLTPEQKQMLDECLFPLIQTMHSNLAGKITGMLLEIDSLELLHMLESPSLSAPTWMKLWRSYRLIMPRKKVPRSQKKSSSPDKALACLPLHVDLSSVSQDLAIEGTPTYIVHSAIFRCVDPWKQAPMHLELVLRNKRSHRNEKTAHRNEE